MKTIINFDGKPVDAYSKKEVMAMLEQIQLEIEEKGIELYDDGWYLNYSDIIQEKINALREDEL